MPSSRRTANANSRSTKGEAFIPGLPGAISVVRIFRLLLKGKGDSRRNWSHGRVDPRLVGTGNSSTLVARIRFAEWGRALNIVDY